MPYLTVQVPTLPAIRNFHPQIINDAADFANSGVGFVDVDQIPFPFQFSAADEQFTHILISITTQVGYKRKLEFFFLDKDIQELVLLFYPRTGK